MSKLFNLKAAYPLLKTLYDVEVSGEDFEDFAINAWELIGNKHTRLYKYTGATENGELKLPCNVDQIESVHIPMADFQMTSNKADFNNYEALGVESYIDAWNAAKDPLYEKGKLVNYKEGDNVLYFGRDWPEITVIYQGVLVDPEDGLPLINDKEMRAIASYIAWAQTYKTALKKRDVNLFKIAASMESSWLRKCNAARIPEHLSQNDMNTILDVKYRWDRKKYGKSLIPVV